MPRKNDDLFPLLTLLPWWANLLLAPLAYVFLSRGVPAILGDNLLAPLFGPAFGFLGIVVGALFVLGAVLSFFAARRKRRLLDRQTGLASIRALSWREFEELVAEAYRRDGYRVVENDEPGPDGGVDIRLRRNGALHLVQCKNWLTRRVGVRVVREVYGVLAAERAQQAVIVCSGDFTEDARRFAAGKPIRLVDGEAQLALVQGVRPASGAATPSPDPDLADRTDTRPLCPRCGGRLVVRTAKRGDHAGRRFLGCETFPRCRHIENLADA
ncbi:MAG: restriction endonuclease [Acidobacteria bacterium]|nr:restriction endonuclease [Acidobacteriota bacterium]